MFPTNNFQTVFNFTDADLGGLVGLAVPALFWLGCVVLILVNLRSALFPKMPTMGRTIGLVVPGNQTDDRSKYEIEINGRSLEVPEAGYRMIDPAKTYTIYTVEIGDTKFTVEEHPYYAFKEGAVYNVYYVPSLDNQPIVAAEQLG